MESDPEVNIYNSSFVKDLPEMCTAKHLVNMGIYPTENAVASARRRGVGPTWLRLRSRIFYPKKPLLQFLVDSIDAGIQEIKQEEPCIHENFYPKPPDDLFKQNFLEMCNDFDQASDHLHEVIVNVKNLIQKEVKK